MSHRHAAAARPPRTTPTRLAAVAAAVVAVAFAAVLLATLRDAPALEHPEQEAAAAPVSHTVLGCPPGRGDAALKVASAGGLPEPTPSGGTADVSLEQPPAEDRTLGLGRGSLVVTGVDAADLVLTAEGDAAQGLLALRAERSGSTLAAAGCPAPRPVWWFAGAGGGVDHSSQLFLTNTDEGPAVVDVRLHGATGSVDRAGTRGIMLAPGKTVRLPLAEIAPGSDELTVEVVATRGRVVAHVLDTVRLGDGVGREWLPPAGPPGEDVVLTAVPSGAARDVLLVTNPGEDQALVDLELLTMDGAFVPLGTEQVSVDPDTVVRVDVTEALKGRAAAVHLSAETPVTGAVRATSAGSDDVAYAGAATALTGPVGLTVAGESTEVLVAGGEKAGTGELILFAADGEQVSRQGYTAPPSGLVRIPLPAQVAYAVLLPRAGDGYAAAVHTTPGAAVQPATPLPTTVLRPVVLPFTGESADTGG